MFLAIPCKKPQNVDMVQPLMRYVKDTYSEEIYSNCRKSFDDLNELRKKVVAKIFDRHESTVDLLKKYHDSLLSLESRIPLADNGAIIEFKWLDGLSEGSLFSKNSMKSNYGAFERLCVLHSIGAVLSQIAANQSLNEDSGLQTAVKLFKTAAGMFSQVRTSLPTVIQTEPSTDMQTDSLILFVTLMLAQAQEAIFIKAERDSMMSSMVAKVAAEAANLYGTCYQTTMRPSNKGKYPKTWSTHLSYKQRYFEVMTNWHYGKACADDKNFGEQIARLKKLVQLASSQAKSLAGENKTAKSIYESLKHDLEKAEKENNCIYHASVPDQSKLTEVVGMAVAKPSPVECPLGDDFVDPFTALVPLGVQLNLDSAQKILNDLIQEEVRRLKEATDTCNWYESLDRD
ncbi:Rhophilin, Rho GTPase binding protein [Cichlidogyrus casuarinus]|uniref:Rhophilin, Rho GTPase binding protein n=1 Tax=Cichlidogyrus casuarinus TaxID=1844966 RepID=A0ABD2Q029_9PLAT